MVWLFHIGPRNRFGLSSNISFSIDVAGSESLMSLAKARAKTFGKTTIGFTKPCWCKWRTTDKASTRTRSTPSERSLSSPSSWGLRRFRDFFIARVGPTLPAKVMCARTWSEKAAKGWAASIAELLWRPSVPGPPVWPATRPSRESAKSVAVAFDSRSASCRKYDKSVDSVSKALRQRSKSPELSAPESKSLIRRSCSERMWKVYALSLRVAALQLRHEISHIKSPFKKNRICGDIPDSESSMIKSEFNCCTFFLASAPGKQITV